MEIKLQGILNIVEAKLKEYNKDKVESERYDEKNYLNCCEESFNKVITDLNLKEWLGKTDTRAYEKRIALLANIISSYYKKLPTNTYFLQFWHDIVEEAIELSNKHINEENDLLAFSLYFIMFTRLRRDKRSDRLNRFYKKYSPLFSIRVFPIIDHIENLYLETLVRSKDDRINLVANSFQNAERRKEKGIEQPGIFHMFAISVADYYMLYTFELVNHEENEETNTLDIKINLSPREIINKAIDYVNDALKREPDYSKYYVTRGRLTALLNEDYERAINMVNQAHEYVGGDEAKKIEIINALNEIENVKTKYDVDALHDIVALASKKTEEVAKKAEDASYQAEEVSKDLGDEKGKIITITSLIISVIGFVIGGASAFSANNDPRHIPNILSLYGGFFIIISALIIIVTSLTYSDKKPKKRLFIAGIVLTLVGLAFVLLGALLW